MGEIHVNVWRENLDEGIEVTFRQKGVCPDNGLPRYELEFKTKSSGTVSFWTCEPEQMFNLMFRACLAIIPLTKDRVHRE